ncbi:hypothetical protein GCM10010441_21010 [Kitasatospora paracochleata]|uniref:Uncharacterized protein n=1 Tax=Kitasatospora paracochleata TaxID=58354 RepID=A0ABT1J7W2_9ACTN|nr:hypothetical protein [Kitasatospora paracochleata]MCP2313523.1 hypothetical protein [Kitasatospora paracochleata]
MDTNTGRVIDEQTELARLLEAGAETEAESEPSETDGCTDLHGDYEDIILRSVN